MKILVFHTGSLGDTLVAVPAFRAVREHFKGAHITLLTDSQRRSKYLSSYEVLKDSGLIDECLTYPAGASGWWKALHAAALTKLLVEIRRRRADAMVYLLRNGRSRKALCRDLAFFRMAGVTRFAGVCGFSRLPPKQPGSPLPRVPHQTDQILHRLAASGIAVPPPGQAKLDLAIGDAERAAVDAWVSQLPPDGGRPWIGVGPGSKMPAKVWPAERYAAVIGELIKQHDVWPVVFGGPEDRELGARLIATWGRGYVAAGFLNIRQGIAALERCVFYLGNDTGTMHMAVAAGRRCVAIFSSRDYPGNWYPYGSGHIVFRKAIDCEGCMLEVCTERENACIAGISTAEAYDACERILQEELGRGERLRKA